MSTSRFVLGCLGGVILLGVFIWIGVALRIAYTKMDVMLEHLKNCSLITTLSQLKQGGPWGKLLLVGSVSGVVTFPAFYIKRGRASAEDLSNFPVLLKRKLVVLQWVGIILLGSAFLLWFIGKVIGWLD